MNPSPPGGPRPSSNLLAWRTRHEGFADAVRTLCRVAPERDPERFGAVLGPLRAALLLHMAQEETVLLPATAGLALPPNGTPTVIRRDHELLRGILAGLPAEVRTAEDVLGRAGALVRLGEVLDHHDRREAAGMLRVLDEHVPAEVRAGWLASFRAQEDGLPPIPALRPLPAPSPLPADLPPLDALRLAAAQDAPLDPISAVPVPDHPKGPRLHARLVRAVEGAHTSDLSARRDALVEVLRAATLLGLVR